MSSSPAIDVTDGSVLAVAAAPRALAASREHEFAPDAVLPQVSAVIVNWNRLDDVLSAVRSVRACDYPQDRIEVVVVDNGSDDGSPARLAHEPGVRLVCLGANVGPSAARNEGIRAATGDYVLLLDSDAILSPRGLAAAVARMQAEPDVGILGFRILDADTRQVDQWIYAQPFATHGRRTFDTYSFSAAGALLRTDVVRAVGGFWERLFIYNEEVDLSIRVMRAGHRIIYAPDATALHRRASAGRRGGDDYFRQQIRNWIWIFLRHYPRCACWWMVTAYSGVYVLKGLTNGRLRAATTGIVEGLRGYAICREFAEKMSLRQAWRMRVLNRRWRVRLWNVTPTAARHASEPSMDYPGMDRPMPDDADDSPEAAALLEN